jgi:hypothetical protein
MKTNQKMFVVTLLIAILLAALTGCKKDNPQPATPVPVGVISNAIKFVNKYPKYTCTGDGNAYIQYQNVMLFTDSADAADPNYDIKQKYFARQNFQFDYTFENIGTGVYWYHSYTSQQWPTPCNAAYTPSESLGKITISNSSVTIKNIP